MFSSYRYISFTIVFFVAATMLNKTDEICQRVRFDTQFEFIDRSSKYSRCDPVLVGKGYTNLNTNMFRAIKKYDGSDSSKCITLTVGDTISAVHSLDETWFIGFNERTKDIGAFPIECVEAVGNEYGPLPAKDDEGQKMDEKAIYANVSKQIQARMKKEANGQSEDDPIQRSRTLSTHAKSFDVNKMRATKPEKTFRLTQVKKDDEDDESELKPDELKHLSLVKPEEVFSLPGNADEQDDKSTLKVRFSEVNLEHSISVADSTYSWQDSFEMSYDGAQYARPIDVMGQTPKKEKSQKVEEDGKYHKLKRSSLQESREKLSGRPITGNVLMIVGVVMSSLLTLGIIYTILLFCFGYTLLEAGVIVGVSALIMAICCGLSSTCRCVMLLVIQYLLTARCKTLWLCILTGLILSYPIVNIVHNTKEASQSLTCLTNLVEKQSKALDRQLAKPFKDIVDYVDHQRMELKAVSNNIELALGNVEAHLENFYGSLKLIDDFLANIVQNCKQPFVDAVNYCSTHCTTQPTDIKNQCLQACSFMYQVSVQCDPIKDARRAEAINTTAATARSAIGGVNEYFQVDIQAAEVINPIYNDTQVSNITNNTVEIDVENRANDFVIFIMILQKLLSFSIILMFIQPFVYIKNYLSLEGFDNIYVTRKFRTMDRESETGQEKYVLPLKQRERNMYADTTSFKLSLSEMRSCKEGIRHILLHLGFSAAILLFDYALYYILFSARNYGDFEIAHENQERLQLNVTGNSQVADFYRVMLKAVNLDKSFTMSLDINLCLPHPDQPNIGVLVTVIVLYILLILSGALAGYSNRIRRCIVAYYYPEREVDRQVYLKQQILIQRDTFTKNLSQRIESYHRESKIRKNLSFISRLAHSLFCIPVMKYANKLQRVKCSGCQIKENKTAVILTPCSGGHKRVPCVATYCRECKDVIADACPICSKEALYST